MGLLDELKQQAQARQQTSQGRSQMILAVDAGLREVYRYLSELASSLNTVKPQVPRSFYIAGAAKLDNLMQCDYAARYRRKPIDFVDYFNEVTLSFRCAGPQNLVLEKETPPAIDGLRDFLWERNLRFDCREIKNDRGMVQRAVFTITSDVPASATFAGNWDSGQVTLTLKNIDKLGSVDYVYDTAELTVELMEEFSKFLLGQQNNFHSLGKHQETMRTMPRPKPVQRETVYPNVEPQPDAAPEPEQKPGLLSTLKSLFKR